MKGRETFYRRNTVPITSCSEVKFVLKKVVSGMKLSINQVWDRTGVSRSTAQKIVEEKKMVNYWPSDIARGEMHEPCGYISGFRWWRLRDRHSKRERGWNLEIPSTVMKLLNKYKTKQKQNSKKHQKNIQLQIKTRKNYFITYKTYFPILK